MLPKRLQLVLSYVPSPAVVYDVGADEGLLSIALEKLGHKVYAGENKKGPYSRLVEHLKAEKSSVVPLFSDGVDVLPEDVDTLVLAGMGGRTIAGILLRHPLKMKQIRTVVVEPQSETGEVVKALEALGFKNEGGQYLKETRIYPLLRYGKGEGMLAQDAFELSYGPYPVRKKDPLLRELLEECLGNLSLVPPSPARDQKEAKIQEELRRWN